MKKPNCKDYQTNCGMHAAMRDYARALDKAPLTVKVTFQDDSVLSDTFAYATKEVAYKTPDGEKYWQAIDSSLVRNEFLPGDDMKASDFKKAYLVWLDSPIKSIKWGKAE